MGQSASQPNNIYVSKQFSSPFSLTEKTVQTFSDSVFSVAQSAASSGSFLEGNFSSAPLKRGGSFNITSSSTSSSKQHSPGSSGIGAMYLGGANSTGIGELLYGGSASVHSKRERRRSVCAREVRVEKYSIRHEDLIKSYSLRGYFVMDSANVFVNDKLVVQYCHIFGPISNKSHYMKRYVSTQVEETLNLGNDSKWVGKDFDFIIKHDYKRMITEEKLTLPDSIIVSTVEEIKC
ncbi:hypothetical protein NAEGRDRAFT_80755 [Naegleria gruberi]|uniref:Uncharacterized protein n=1 Tax=Naegleria gruberi TaxID=5762 RepID=D2VPG0_NAEGR|nr:uncharacterized protein NAEGRDRAFT_80755 [Naegleria gruberi]EFC41352.1 hypothetical protein NAEGRDRAFT_80755 [Naegleria gruberi]|eukprot:XP_002674096.1 hypothetical protein NAEGRDRAFT_80755 [Naegleria gruberi strain NEG-M]